MNKFINIEEPENKTDIKKIALFSYGFRPFFLGASLYAMIATFPWFAYLFDEDSIFYLILKTSDFPMIWHSHEMLYGFVSASIAGFLLTAIPNWTGCKPIANTKLIIVFTIWLLGRISFWTMEFIPIFYHVDLLFFPVLSFMIGSVLIKAGKLKNLAFLVILMALFLCNLTIHYGISTSNYDISHIGIMVTLYLISIMIAIIGGRIIPNFSRMTLKKDQRKQNIRSVKLLDISSILTILLVAIFEIIQLDGLIVGILSLAIFSLHIIRLFLWQGWKVYYSPILWILHVGYLFLPIGFLLKGLGEFSVVDSIIYIHILTIGMIGVMIIGVMSRVALGHTGRKLSVSKITIASYICIILSVFFRAIIPIGDIVDYDLAQKISATLWLLSFTLFAIVYVPILIMPRVDGKKG